jgi:protein gp37
MDRLRGLGPARRAEADVQRLLEGAGPVEQGGRQVGARACRRRRVFCASLADVFDNQVPPEWRADLWLLIRETPELDWQLLTKRPQNIARMLPSDWSDGYPNVWFGATTENQEEFDRRWPILARIPAIVRFVSYEPAIGLLTLTPSNGHLPDWVICGGESGSHSRMMEPAWARSMRDQCRDLGVPFFMKQMTGKAPIPSDLMVRQFPGVGPYHF